MIGKNRKSELRALFSDPVPAVKSEPTDSARVHTERTTLSVDRTPEVNIDHNPAVPRAASGAVKAMGLSLSSITRDAEEVRSLRQALDAGEHVIELDTSLIDASFVSDRLSHQEQDDPEFLTLVESMRESGQQVPILVRRNPADPERFQVAYGHRRLNAARRLGIAVKALVRALNDDQLILAQGKENAERRNLTFIERALFAKALSERGFDRKVIGEALSVQKSELSRLFQVADSVPDSVARAIGPAPKVGRERWMSLAQLLSNDQDQTRAAAFIQTEVFRSLSTDERFQTLYDTLLRKAPTERPEPDMVRGPDGRIIARIIKQGRRLKIEFQADVDPGFLKVFDERLAADYKAYLSHSKC